MSPEPTDAPTPGRVRPRRLRSTEAMRRLVREVDVHPRQLVLPVFVREGLTEPRPIDSMPGVVQHTLDSLRGAVAQAAAARLGGVMVFAVPEVRDATGTQATEPDGILNRALAVAVSLELRRPPIRDDDQRRGVHAREVKGPAGSRLEVPEQAQPVAQQPR